MIRGAICRATFLGTLLLVGSSTYSQESSTPAHPNFERRTAYPNSSDGLRKLLQDVLAAAKAGDSSKLAAFVRGMEIPDYEAWFTRTFGQERGESWAGPYGKELGENEATLQQFFRQHAGANGFIATRSVNDWPDPGNDLEKSMMDSGDFQRLDIYVAEWRPDGSGKPVDWIGYFYFLDGKFRWDSTLRF